VSEEAADAPVAWRCASASSRASFCYYTLRLPTHQLLPPISCRDALAKSPRKAVTSHDNTDSGFFSPRNRASTWPAVSTPEGALTECMLA